MIKSLAEFFDLHMLSRGSWVTWSNCPPEFQQEWKIMYYKYLDSGGKEYSPFVKKAEQNIRIING